MLGAPTGKRLAPVIGELVPTLRRFGELEMSEETAALLVAMSAATIERRLAPDRASMAVRGRSHTKPGSLLKDSIPIRTWAQWTENRSVRNKAGRHAGRGGPTEVSTVIQA